MNIVRPAYAYKIESPTPQFGSIGDILTVLLPNLLVAAGLLTFFYLIFGGFKYLTAGGDEKAVMAAKTTLTNAVIGLIIIFCSYWIIRIIETIFGLHIVFLGV